MRELIQLFVDLNQPKNNQEKFSNYQQIINIISKKLQKIDQFQQSHLLIQLQCSMEDIFEVENNNKITQQEVYLKAIKELKEMYMKELKRIKKAKHIRQISQSELCEQTKKIFNQYELLLEQQKKCKQSQPQDLNDQVILSVKITQKQNYLIKTQKGIHYQCKCHKMEFQTHQELGGHQRTLK